jgi:hypothetical protein
LKVSGRQSRYPTQKPHLPWHFLFDNQAQVIGQTDWHFQNGPCKPDRRHFRQKDQRVRALRTTEKAAGKSVAVFRVAANRPNTREEATLMCFVEFSLRRCLSGRAAYRCLRPLAGHKRPEERGPTRTTAGGDDAKIRCAWLYTKSATTT